MLKSFSFTIKFLNKCFFSSSFRSSDIIVKKVSNFKVKPENCDNIAFGSVFTDHMLQIDWNYDQGWSKPIIKPLENFSLHPASIVFHYAAEIFEGMKAFYGDDEVIRLFRPNLNMKRFLRSSERAALPKFDPNELLECIKKLISIEKEWIPKKRGHSLYIRPTLIGVDPKLGVARSNSAILYVILCPVGAYYPTGFKPVSLMADPNYVRAWVGGTGDCKMGANYAPTIYVADIANELGCQQVLWLYGDDHLISECGTMNLFMYWINKKGSKEVVTPPLNGTILPGVTRDSLISLLKAENDIQVSEREVSMKELIETLKENRLKEMFGAGTACVVSPIERIDYEDIQYKIPTMEEGAPLTTLLLKNLSDIQYGSVDKSDWIEIVH